MMFRRIASIVVLAGALVAPLSAELKYTTRIEMRASSTPNLTPADPMMEMIGNMMTEMMVPAGGLEVTIVEGAKGARVEYNKAYLVMPAGAVSLLRPDGSMVVLNPADKTYWTVGADASALPPGMTPKLTTKRTGEFADVAGARSERVTIDLRIAIPVPDGVQLPPGMPTELVLTGDMWITDRFKASNKSAGMAMGGLGQFGLDKVLNGGMPMRSVMRSPLFAGKEIETVVTKIGEGPAEASLFEIPADYKEVPAPTGMGRIGGGPRG